MKYSGGMMNSAKTEYKRIAVIILNYLNYKDTDECVQSVLKQKYPDFHILVVDNGSDNGSFEYLWKKYNRYEKVNVLKAGKNYGFAKGNNIGIHYAKKNFDVEYVMLLNNDTVLEDVDYIQKMMDVDHDKVGVVGSRIIERDCGSVRKYKRYVAFPATLFYFLSALSEYNNQPASQAFWEKILKKYEGVYVFRACVLLLTPAYFRYYDGLDPRTFLYCEEELLYQRCKRAGLKEIINDKTYLLHKHKKSTKMAFDNDNKIYLKYMLSSYKFVLWESVKMFFQKQQRG